MTGFCTDVFGLSPAIEFDCEDEVADEPTDLRPGAKADVTMGETSRT